MAVGTAAALTGGGGLLLSGYKALTGKDDMDEAKDDFNNFERQSLDNAYKNIQISTLGADIQREESQRNAASLFDILQGGGARSIVGGIPKVVGTLNNVNQQIAKDLDQQFINREYAIAGDNARIEGIQENRDNMNLSNIAQRYNAGKTDFMDGLTGFASTASYIGRNLESNKETNPDVPPAGGPTNFGPPQYPSPYFDFGSSLYYPRF